MQAQTDKPRVDGKRKWLARSIGFLGVVGVLVATYFYSLCVLLESDCVMGRAGSCAALARTMRLAAVLGSVSVALGVASVVLSRRGRRARSRRQSDGVM